MTHFMTHTPSTAVSELYHTRFSMTKFILVELGNSIAGRCKPLLSAIKSASQQDCTMIDNFLA